MSRIQSPRTNAPITIARSGSVRKTFVLHGNSLETNGETSCLTLVWAVLDLYITHAKNGVRFNQLDRQRLRRIRNAGSEPTTDEELTAA